MSSQISPNQEIFSELLQKSDQLKEEIEQLDDKCAEIRKANPMVPKEIWSSLRTERWMLLSGSDSLSYLYTGSPYELTQDENQAIHEYGEARHQIGVKEALLSYVTDTLSGLRKPQPKKRITDSLTYLAGCFTSSDDLFFERVCRLYRRFEVAYEKGMLPPDIPVDTVSLGGRQINPHILKETYHRLKEADQLASLEENVFVVLDEENYTKFTFREELHLVTPRQGEAIKILHQAYKTSPSFPDASGVDTVKQLGPGTSSLRDTFRRTQAEKLWGTLIVQGEKKGFYRLNI